MTGDPVNPTAGELPFADKSGTIYYVPPAFLDRLRAETPDAPTPFLGRCRIRGLVFVVDENLSDRIVAVSGSDVEIVELISEEDGREDDDDTN